MGMRQHNTPPASLSRTSSSLQTYRWSVFVVANASPRKHEATQTRPLTTDKHLQGRGYTVFA
jgi:hypothetical protein